MKILKFNEFILENEKKVKYVVWELNTTDYKKVSYCSVTFRDSIHGSPVARPFEQHHPKLFEEKNGMYRKTKLAIKLGVNYPNNSYSLECFGKNIYDFLNFWKKEGYILIYNAEKDEKLKKMFDEFIKDNNLDEFIDEEI